MKVTKKNKRRPRRDPDPQQLVNELLSRLPDKAKCAARNSRDDRQSGGCRREQ